MSAKAFGLFFEGAIGGGRLGGEEWERRLQAYSSAKYSSASWPSLFFLIGKCLYRKEIKQVRPSPLKDWGVPGCLKKGLCFSVVGFLGLDHFFPVSGFEVKNLQKIALFSPGRFFFPPGVCLNHPGMNDARESMIPEPQKSLNLKKRVTFPRQAANKPVKPSQTQSNPVKPLRVV